MKNWSWLFLALPLALFAIGCSGTPADDAADNGDDMDPKVTTDAADDDGAGDDGAKTDDGAGDDGAKTDDGAGDDGAKTDDGAGDDGAKTDDGGDDGPSPPPIDPPK